MTMFRLFFPINIFVMKLFNFSNYDLIISSSASTAKYLNKKGAKHICYCYIPTRAIWNTQAYFGNAGLKTKVFLLLINFFKKNDYRIYLKGYNAFMIPNESSVNFSGLKKI